MSRLIAFGCSLTYGEGLKDCWLTEGLKHPTHGKAPSKYAWPNLLAKRLYLEPINLGNPGTSNKWISHQVLKTDFKKTDTVIFLWTYFSRTCFFIDDVRHKRILQTDMANTGVPKERRKNSSFYFKLLHETYNDIFDNYVLINFTRNYLKERHIKQFHFTVAQEKEIPEWTSVKLKKIELDFTLPLAQDNRHPGEKAQEKITDQIYNHIMHK